MSSSFLRLAVGSLDLSQAEKEITVCKAEQVHKMTTQSKNSIWSWVNKFAIFSKTRSKCIYNSHWGKFNKSPPPPRRGQFLYSKRGQKQTFFDPLSPHLVQVVIECPLTAMGRRQCLPLSVVFRL